MGQPKLKPVVESITAFGNLELKFMGTCEAGTHELWAGHADVVLEENDSFFPKARVRNHALTTIPGLRVTNAKYFMKHVKNHM
ncbi:hypothetical protein L596_029690 [Steinernema carpocapsae]|uniref:Uncharacterized protein n=1 Tax=Steinernema carpocapsae TaxID=34508 RepID=A0A4U5LQE9_STECR|nr:hypothetical protein L596_029690 [Steinernema carpocapsae]